MTTTRLSALDDSFLTVESPTAHMHVGWGAVFEPPESGDPPRFAELRNHIESRLGRAPRYRQRIAPVPFGLSTPLWVDDDRFDVNRHVIASSARSFSSLVDECMSHQLPRDRPLWEICIADRLEDGRIGVACKAHHCMVDGIAAVELATLLLDPTPEPPPPDGDGWRPEEPPGAVRRLVAAFSDGARETADLVRLPARRGFSRERLSRMQEEVRKSSLALANAFRQVRRVPPINQPISPGRHLARLDRPLADLKRIAKAHDATVNDVLLAICAGGMRAFLEGRDEAPTRLKTMVPVSVRGDNGGALGNEISFVFIDLPCDEADPVRRLERVQEEMGECKSSGQPEGGSALLGALGYAPRVLRRAASLVAASPNTFNLTISNIPGPSEPMYMLGCELAAAYPVVPLADEHALSIGMTTVRDHAYFGLYTDCESLPDADQLAAAIEDETEELLRRSGSRRRWWRR